MFILNGYEYSIAESMDKDGNPLSITEEDEAEVAKDLEAFLSCIEEHSEDELQEWEKIKAKEGLSERVCHKLYELFFDLCYYGDMEESELMERFSIKEDELGYILA